MDGARRPFLLRRGPASTLYVLFGPRCAIPAITRRPNATEARTVAKLAGARVKRFVPAPPGPNRSAGRSTKMVERAHAPTDPPYPRRHFGSAHPRSALAGCGPALTPPAPDYASGFGPMRSSRLRAETAAICSSFSAKSKSAKFSSIRDREFDLGKMISPRWSCQRRTT